MSVPPRTLRLLNLTLNSTKQILDTLYQILTIREENRQYYKGIEPMRCIICNVFDKILKCFEKTKEKVQLTFLEEIIGALKNIRCSSSSIEYSIQPIKEIRTMILIQLQIECEHEYNIHPNQSILTKRIKCLYCDKSI